MKFLSKYQHITDKEKVLSVFSRETNPQLKSNMHELLSRILQRRLGFVMIKRRERGDRLWNADGAPSALPFINIINHNQHHPQRGRWWGEQEKSVKMYCMYNNNIKKKTHPNNYCWNLWFFFSPRLLQPRFEAAGCRSALNQLPRLTSRPAPPTVYHSPVLSARHIAVLVI